MKTLKIFLVLISLYSFVYADNNEYKHKHRYKDLRYLDLNSTQIKDIRNILIEFKKKYHNFYKDEDEIEDKIEDIFKAKKFDKEKYIEILQNHHQKSISLEAEKLEKIHAILNNKQRKRFAKHLEEWDND